MVLPDKTPRLDLNSNQNSDPIRGLNILQLLSLPPETVFEWFRLSCKCSASNETLAKAVFGKNLTLFCFSGIGEKQHGITHLPVRQPSILSNTLEKYKLNEKIDSLLTDLRSSMNF